MNTAYIEIGGRCFSNCIMCNAKKGGDVDVSIILDRIDKLYPYFKQIRLAGGDPMMHSDFSYIIRRMHDMGIETDVTTTLLTQDSNDIRSLAYYTDVLRISLLGVDDTFIKMYNVDKFNLFCDNLNFLMSIREESFVFNYTFVKNKNDSIKHAAQLHRFISNLPYQPIIHFFPEIRYTNEWAEEEFLDLFVQYMKDFKYVFFSGSPKKMSSCNVNTQRLYVKSNGDCYPCCMAGGEIGQDLLPELKLGNLDTDDLKTITDKKLENLDNYICNKCTPKYYNLM